MVKEMEEGRGKEEGGARRSTRGFRKLVAWERAMDLASSTYSATRGRSLPPWLESQLMGAALSVPSNIAEGYTRSGIRDYLRFLDVALAELESDLYFMVENDLLAESLYAELDQKASDVGNILVALMPALSCKLNDGSWNRFSEETADYVFQGEDDSLLPISSFLLPGEEA